MNRATLARRYGPLAVVVAGQLLIIAAVPSKAPNEARLAAGSANGPGAESAALGSGNGAAATAGRTPAAGATDAGSTAATNTAGGTAAGPTARPTATGGTGSAAGVQTATATAQDTAHCVAGRTFDPALAYFAPPCVPGTPGGPYPDNGGATYQGVTKDAITIVDYVSNYGAEV